MNIQLSKSIHCNPHKATLLADAFYLHPGIMFLLSLLVWLKYFKLIALNFSQFLEVTRLGCIYVYHVYLFIYWLDLSMHQFIKYVYAFIYHVYVLIYS